MFSIDYGDVLIFSTDGVRPGFTGGLSLGVPIRAMAERILKDYARGNDDALVLAVRYLGRQSRG
jgi:hypothetical protein